MESILQCDRMAFLPVLESRQVSYPHAGSETMKYTSCKWMVKRKDWENSLPSQRHHQAVKVSFQVYQQQGQLFLSWSTIDAKVHVSDSTQCLATWEQVMYHLQEKEQFSQLFVIILKYQLETWNLQGAAYQKIRSKQRRLTAGQWSLDPSPIPSWKLENMEEQKWIYFHVHLFSISTTHVHAHIIRYKLKTNQ